MRFAQALVPLQLPLFELLDSLQWDVTGLWVYNADVNGNWATPAPTFRWQQSHWSQTTRERHFAVHVKPQALATMNSSSRTML